MATEFADVPGGAGERSELISPRAFFNRELSWIEFNWRVLKEAANERHPLLERLKFLAISDSNLDEFFMVRVSGLLGEIEAGVSTQAPDGRTPEEELHAVRAAIRRMTTEQQRFLQKSLLPALNESGVRLVGYDDLTRTQRHELATLFEREIFPVCTPLAIDPAQSFPFISNLSLNLLVVLSTPEGAQLQGWPRGFPRHLARLKVPPFPRFVRLPGRVSRTVRFIWLEDLLRQHLDALFPGLHIDEVYPFRVLRDADFEVREIEAGDLLEKVRAGLQMRRFGEAVALQVDERMPPDIRELLTRDLGVEREDVYAVGGRLGLADLMQLHDLDRPDLKDEPFIPHVPAVLADSPDIFAAIQERDIVLHHPFDSFDPIIDLLSQAATDPNVLAIKQTLYRVGLHSPVVDALRMAVDRGKQVAVLLELKARFDEENNIAWAEELERAGVHVMYGFAGLKTHCKVALIVRREANAIRRYVHIGTGNYNRATARSYTDIGLLTCREDVATDASDLFNFLTGYSRHAGYRALLVAPVNLREGIRTRIEREAGRQNTHGDGRLIFKMNALTDPDLIQSLYAASQAGVQIDLLVRGICCLRPGVAGLSANIRVFALLGRLLEHSRVYYFRNGGEEEILIGSADLMQRNLDYRVEALVPIFDASIRAQLKDVLEGYLRDTVQTSQLHPDGEYVRRDATQAPFDMQRWLLDGAGSRLGAPCAGSSLPLSRAASPTASGNAASATA